MNKFKLHILSAERDYYNGDCVSLKVPITDGLYGIQANHKNMVAAILPGILDYQIEEGKHHEVIISQGVLIVAENDVRILVDKVETKEEALESEKNREIVEQKEKELQKRSIQEFKSAQIWIARENSRLARRHLNREIK